MATTSNLKIKRGDDKYYALTFTYDSGSTIDISDWIIFFTVKKDMDDSDDDAVIKQNIGTGQDYDPSDPTNGVSRIHLTDSNTSIDIRNYYYDVQVKKSNGDILTILEGSFTVTPDISNRTS